MLVAALEVDEAALDLREVWEAVRGEHLAVDDGEIDLDLVEPRGVDRAVNQAQFGMASLLASGSRGRRLSLPEVDQLVSGAPADLPGAAATQG